MLNSKSKNTREFMADLAKMAGSFVLVTKMVKEHTSIWAKHKERLGDEAEGSTPGFRILSEQTLRVGRMYVTSAILRVREALATGDVKNVSADEYRLIEAFGNKEHVDDLFKLGDFPAFWDSKDRGLRSAVLFVLSNYAGRNDLQKLMEFNMKLGQIKYTDHSQNEDFDPERQSTPDQLARMDRQLIEPILLATRNWDV